MTDDDERDRELRDAFARLRQEERPATPFRLPVRARRTARSRHLVPLLLAAAAAIILVLQLSDGRVDPSPRQGPPPLSSWEMPTDFLLETPGHELLRAIPPIGLIQGMGGEPATAPPDTDLPHTERRPS